MTASVRGKGGFTLLEIVVALGILAIAMGTLLATLNKTIYAVADSARMTSAVTLAREEMERYRMEQKGLIMAAESVEADGSARKNELYPDLEFTREMNETAIPKAFELVVTVYKAGGETPPELFTLRQYVKLDYDL